MNSGTFPDRAVVIHDVGQCHVSAFFSGPDTICFDDGLYSQYNTSRLVQAPAVYFIATGLVRPGPARPRTGRAAEKPVKERRAMHQAFALGDYSLFMTTDEVQELARTPGLVIGAHGHAHDVVATADPPKKPVADWKRACHGRDLVGPAKSLRSALAHPGLVWENGRYVPRSRDRWLDHVKRDTEACCRWFAGQIGRVPEDFAFPFNEGDSALVDVLETFGFRRFWGGPSPKDPRIVPRQDADRVLAGA